MAPSVYQSLTQRKLKAQKSFAILIDPDKVSMNDVDEICRRAVDAKVDYLLAGGSLVVSNRLDEVIVRIRQVCKIPVLLFPGSPAQVSKHAHALLYLSLISGRNPELLIGQHVISAPFIRQSGLEIISTGYMLVDGGAPTTASYISNALPLPFDKPEIAICTAMAGEMLGMKVIYLDAGSGAKRPVTETLISAVADNISVPLIVGGGIATPEKAYHSSKAGADLVVVGNAIEKEPALIAEMSSAVHMLSATPRIA